MEDTLARPTVVPVKSMPLRTGVMFAWDPKAGPLSPAALPTCPGKWPAPMVDSRDKLCVVMWVPPCQALRPPGQEVLQRDVGMGADMDFVPTVPDLQTHQDYAEIELLIKLGGDRELRIRLQGGKGQAPGLELPSQAGADSISLPT